MLSQQLVLGPLLYVVYINDLDELVGGMVSKYVNSTKCGGIVDGEAGYLRLQWDLAQQVQHVEEWQVRV